jgi:hypothetical protein
MELLKRSVYEEKARQWQSRGSSTVRRVLAFIGFRIGFRFLIVCY